MGKLLIAECAYRVREFLSHFFRERGFAVVTCVSAGQIIPTIRSEKPRAVVCDCDACTEEDPQALDLLFLQKHLPPLILISGRLRHDFLSPPIRHTVLYLKKPVILSDLSDTVDFSLWPQRNKRALKGMRDYARST